jgi:hypothetical protein
VDIDLFDVSGHLDEFLGSLVLLVKIDNFSGMCTPPNPWKNPPYLKKQDNLVTSLRAVYTLVTRCLHTVYMPFTRS